MIGSYVCVSHITVIVSRNITLNGVTTSESIIDDCFCERQFDIRKVLIMLTLKAANHQ